VLPAELDLTNTANLEYILAHELYHIKRLDAVWKILFITVACLHWFNPLVWMMCIIANRDLEISCDAWVVKNIAKNQKKNYAYTLIEFAERQSSFTPFYSGFARNAAHERVRSIMKRKRTTVVSVIVAVLFGTVLTLNAFAMAGETAGYDEIEEPVVLETDPDSEPIPDEPLVEEIEEYISLEERLATFSTVTVNDMTFRVGDASLGERTAHTLRPNFEMPADYVSAEDVAIMLALGIYEHLGISVDNMYFDIFLMDNWNFDNLVWTGFIVTPEYWGNAPVDIVGDELHFNFFVSATTGEFRGITHNDNGLFTVYDSNWQEYIWNVD
jgi:ABC-type cobalt transport system substrate-binding protein